MGGGYIAVEFAAIFAGYGSKVSLVYRAENWLRGFDNDLRSHLKTEYDAQVSCLSPWDLMSGPHVSLLVSCLMSLSCIPPGPHAPCHAPPSASHGVRSTIEALVASVACLLECVVGCALCVVCCVLCVVCCAFCVVRCVLCVVCCALCVVRCCSCLTSEATLCRVRKRMRSKE